MRLASSQVTVMPQIVKKSIILLVGPKGSGKSHMGNQISQLFDVAFLRIEEVWRNMRSDHLGFVSPAYVGEGIQRSLRVVSDALLVHDCVVLESTGAFDDFPAFVASLQAMGAVTLVSIRAPLDQGSIRIQGRDPSLHDCVSDDLVERINKNAEAVTLKWDLVLVNEPFVSREKLHDAFSPFLKLRDRISGPTLRIK